eukprot:4722763-Amphidinium_carterae.1
MCKAIHGRVTFELWHGSDIVPDDRTQVLDAAGMTLIERFQTELRTGSVTRQQTITRRVWRPKLFCTTTPRWISATESSLRLGGE